MSTPESEPRPESVPGQPAATPPVAGTPTPVAPPLDVSQLTPEEQMARFEKELKENDWGHQPC